MVWWLAAGSSGQPDLLIALDRSEGASWMSNVRRWLDAHVEAYWTYAWILLAPYVVGMSLRWPLDRKGLGGRLALHLLLGVGFVAASQALTGRLASLRPRAIFIKIKTEETVKPVGLHGTNGSATVLVTRTLEWHGPPGEGGTKGPNLLGDPRVLPPQGTNFLSARLAGHNRLIVWRKDLDPQGAAAPSFTNGILDASAPHDLARHLVPMIEEELKLGHEPGDLDAPRKFGVAFDGLAYLTLIGLAQALHFRRRLGERETQAAALESRLVQSRLHVLQAQLQPHFLFNALNGIALLVRRDPRTAEEMLASLSDLLRASLSRSGRQEIPLREELDFLERYLELQQMRFGDRLTVERHLAPDALECLVPSLVLQPLVENAIRHGFEPSGDPGWIRIAAQRVGNDLVLEVEDNGIGLGGSKRGMAHPGNGLGLGNVCERLSGLYGEDQEFRLQERPEGGVLVRIRIPGRLAPGGDSGRTCSASR